MTQQRYLKLTKIVFFVSVVMELSLLAFVRYGPELTKDWAITSIMIMMCLAAVIISSGATWIEVILIRMLQERRKSHEPLISNPPAKKNS